MYRSECVSSFLIKCLPIHWDQSPLRLTVSSPRFPFSSRAPLYTRFCSVYLCSPRPLSPSSPLNRLQHWFFPSPFSYFSISLSFLSTPFYRAHNCITERLSSQLTLPSSTSHPVTFDLHTYVGLPNKIVSIVHIYNETERRIQRK